MICRSYVRIALLCFGYQHFRVYIKLLLAGSKDGFT